MLAHLCALYSCKSESDFTDWDGTSGHCPRQALLKSGAAGTGCSGLG